MKALIQRVSKGTVSIEGKPVSAINHGFVVFVGVGSGDTEEDTRYLADKIANLRIISDQEAKFNLSILDTNGEVLVVSQFTLFASTRKGRRPSFTEAASPDIAEPLIDRFVNSLLEAGIRKVETGHFQKHMLVEILNDGPVTILIDSQDRHKPRH